MSAPEDRHATHAGPHCPHCDGTRWIWECAETELGLREVCEQCGKTMKEASEAQVRKIGQSTPVYERVPVGEAQRQHVSQVEGYLPAVPIDSRPLPYAPTTRLEALVFALIAADRFEELSMGAELSRQLLDTAVAIDDELSFIERTGARKDNDDK